MKESLSKITVFLSGFFFFAIVYATELPEQEQLEVVAKATSDKEGATPWRYLVFLPEGYHAAPEKEWPFLLYLHGRSVRGTDIEKIKRYGPPAFLKKRKDFPFLTVSPQLPDGAWTADELNALLDELIETYRIDRDRIYLTGVSLGSMGAWTFASAYPERFAALLPICAHGPQAGASLLTGLPIWAFHGAKDKLVPIEPHQKLIEAIREGGGNATLTVYPDGDHGSVIGDTYDNPEVFEWLLKQSRKSNTEKQ